MLLHFIVMRFGDWLESRRKLTQGSVPCFSRGVRRQTRTPFFIVEDGMESKFSIGDRVTFVDHQRSTREGRIVGREIVSDPRRGNGIHFVVATADKDVLDVPADRIGGRIGLNYGK